MLANEQELINRDPEILGGAPVFMGTRVLVETMLDYLAAGQPLDDFLEDFPAVKREQATAVLDMLKQSLETPQPA
jgi:uncharacterized protein (DUF433 family)